MTQALLIVLFNHIFFSFGEEEENCGKCISHACVETHVSHVGAGM